MTIEPARTELISVVTTDIAAITRGRSVPAVNLDRIAAHGVGWVPANQSLTPFDVIADPNPWGSRGDLRLLPDLAARFRVAGSRAATPIDLVMADITELDGAPWQACPRSILKRALADFEAATKLQIWSAFEQEFQIAGAPAAGTRRRPRTTQASSVAATLTGIEPGPAATPRCAGIESTAMNIAG